MKKIYYSKLTAGICSLLIAAAVYGQDKVLYEDIIARQSKGIALSFAKEYGLDQPSREQVEKVFIEYFGAIGALRDSSKSKTQKESSYQEIVKKRDRALKGILTPKQWKKHQAFRARRASDSLSIYYQREKMKEQ